MLKFTKKRPIVEDTKSRECKANGKNIKEMVESISNIIHVLTTVLNWYGLKSVSFKHGVKY